MKYDDKDCCKFNRKESLSTYFSICSKTSIYNELTLLANHVYKNKQKRLLKQVKDLIGSSTSSTLPPNLHLPGDIPKVRVNHHEYLNPYQTQLRIANFSRRPSCIIMWRYRPPSMDESCEESFRKSAVYIFSFKILEFF